MPEPGSLVVFTAGPFEGRAGRVASIPHQSLFAVDVLCQRVIVAQDQVRSPQVAEVDPATGEKLDPDAPDELDRCIVCHKPLDHVDGLPALGPNGMVHPGCLR